MSTDSDGTVMIVDDEEMVVDSIQNFLEFDAPEYRVLPFTSPRAALECLAEEPVHTVVADFMMPELDGVTFLTRARDVRPHATRILLTGYADKKNAIRAINEAGLYLYLEKPWDNEALGLAIRNAVERSQLIEGLSQRLQELEEAHEELEGIKDRWIRAFL